MYQPHNQHQGNSKRLVLIPIQIALFVTHSKPKAERQNTKPGLKPSLFTFEPQAPDFPASPNQHSRVHCCCSIGWLRFGDLPTKQGNDSHLPRAFRIALKQVWRNRFALSNPQRATRNLFKHKYLKTWKLLTRSLSFRFPFIGSQRITRGYFSGSSMKATRVCK